MLRLAVVSDIHGNLPALEAVTADLETFAPDHVVVGGDLLNAVPFSAEVMVHVFSRQWTAIRGNNEFYILQHQERLRKHGAGAALLPLIYAQVAGHYFNLIACLPDALHLNFPHLPPVCVVHGLPGNPNRAITRSSSDAEIRDMLAGLTEPVFIAGHYHLPFARQVDGRQLFNPGAVGQPYDGIRQASYMLLEGEGGQWRASHRRVPYDHARVEAAFEGAGFLELPFGYLMLWQQRAARPLVNAFLDWQARYFPEEALSHRLVDAFLGSGQVWDFLGEGYQVNRELLDANLRGEDVG